MGAFFLYNNNSNIKTEAVCEVFEKKGFRDPHTFDCGAYKLLLWQKQLVECANWTACDGAMLCAVGTVVYKGLSYTPSLKAILADYLKDTLEPEKLRGNFCLIFLRDGQVCFLNDTLNVQHLFTDSARTFITSSFLAAMNAPQGKLTLNRMACLEKLLTGYTVGPETLFNEVVHISRSMRQSCGWTFLKAPEMTIPPAEGRSRSENIKKRTEKIRSYFHDLYALKDEYTPEMGLSDGYDSRVLYAGALDVWKQAIATHTHSTEGAGAHDEEKKIVKDIASTFGSELTVVKTKQMHNYSEAEIKDILLDGLYYYDGRCAYNTGAFSPVYTRKYKIATAGKHMLTLNGLGGEIYRNYYLVSKPFIYVKQWMKAHVYPDSVDDVIGQDLFAEIHKNLSGKISKEMGTSWGNWASNFCMRRFYSEIVLPDCNALNCNAHNQMLFFVTPFIEWDVMYDAYKARKALGTYGELQAGMMRELNERVSGFRSHYGFTFNQKPSPRYRAYALIKGWLPDFIWNARTRHKLKSLNHYAEYYGKTMLKCKYLQEADIYLKSLFPEVNFEILHRDYAMMPNSAYVAVLLYTFRDRIAGASEARGRN